MSGQWRPGGKTVHEVGGDTVADVLRGALGVQQACKAAGLAPEQRGAWARAFRRAALRAFDDGLQQALGGRAGPSDGLGATEFCGPLSELPVMDLVQSMAFGGRDGVIAVSHDGAESRLWCAGGDIVDAESGDLVGEAAVYQVLALERGHVRAELRAVQRQRSVQRPTPALLLEAARLKDELMRTTIRQRVDAASTPSMRPGPQAPPSARRWGSGGYFPALALGAVVAASAVALVVGRDAGSVGWRAPNEPHPQPAVTRLATAQTTAPRSSEQPAGPEVVRATLSPTPSIAVPAPGNATLRGTSPASRPPPTFTERVPASAQARPRRNSAAATRPPSPDVHGARSLASTSLRTTPPLVPRMRIIEERVPQIQIVD